MRFFGVDSFGSFVRNFLVAYGVYLFSIGVNNYIFKYASMLVRCVVKVCLCFTTRKQNISFIIISLVVFLVVVIGLMLAALFVVFYVYKSSTHTDMIQLFAILVIWSLSLFVVVIKFDERKHLLPVYSVYSGNVDFKEDNTNHATTAISRCQLGPECNPTSL